MNALFELVNNLDSTTLGHVQRRIGDPRSKMAQLLKMYRRPTSKGVPNDDMIANKLYEDERSALNALYRLKSRLSHLIDQLLIDIHSGESDDIFTTERHLMLFQIFKLKEKKELAFLHLKKAEKAAGQKEQYSLLDIIYNEFIIFSKDLLIIDPEVYIKRRRENEQMLIHIKTIDEILAIISYRLRLTQNMSEKLDLTGEIESTLGNFAGDDTIFKSLQFKIKFYKTISQILVQQKKYDELEKYLEQTFHDFSKHQLFNKQTHDIKVEQLVYWGNSLLMQRKYDRAIEQSMVLEQALKEHQGILFDKYIYFVYQLQINSYAAINLDKAVELLQKVITSKNVISEPYYLLINSANLAFCYFVQKKFKLVIKTIQSIYRNDFFETTDIHMKAQLAVLEMLTWYELNEPDNFDYRYKQIEKSFNKEWIDYQGIDKDLLKMAHMMLYSTRHKNNADLKLMANDYLKANANNQNRIFNYEEWIVEKLGS
jgi:hypothetical protein